MPTMILIDIVSNRVPNNISALKSDNEENSQYGDKPIIDNNTVLNNIQGNNLHSSKDKLAPMQVRHPVNSEVNIFLTLPNNDCLPEPADGNNGGQRHISLDFVQTYLQLQTEQKNKKTYKFRNKCKETKAGDTVGLLW